MVFELIKGRRFPMALELGAGDGGQSVVLSNYCDHLICTDLDKESHAWLGKTILERELPNVEYKIVDAQDLSGFEDKCFDLIFSSNLLEHIQDINQCLKECHRVLKDDGLMLHTMPNRWWKGFHMLLAPLKLSIPRVHGVSRDHFTEFYRFGRNIWLKTIISHGFGVKEIVGLPFYVGHMNSFIPVIKTGNMLGLSASNLFVVEKVL